MTDFQNSLEALANVPLYLQILVGVSIVGVLATTAVGVIVAWQLSNIAKAIRASAHRPAPPPPPTFGQPEYGPYQQRP